MHKFGWLSLKTKAIVYVKFYHLINTRAGASIILNTKYSPDEFLYMLYSLLSTRVMSFLLHKALNNTLVSEITRKFKYIQLHKLPLQSQFYIFSIKFSELKVTV